MINTFGADIGFKNFKGVNLSRNLEFEFTNIIGNPTPLEIKQAGMNPHTEDLQSLLQDLTIEYANTTYYVGHKAYTDATNHRHSFTAEKVDKIDEKIKLMTALGILSTYGITDIDVFVTGSPVEEYHMIQDKIKQQFTDEYRFKFRGKSVNSIIRRVEVVPQGAADYYDYIIDHNGNVMASKVLPKVVVINIGFRTTEIVTMNNGKFSRSESTTIYTATNSFHKELRRLLAKEYGVRKNLSQIDEIWRSNKVDINGQYIDISNLKSEALRLHIGAILNEIPVWVNPDDVHLGIIAGGGSIGLKHVFENEFKFPIYQSDDPVRSNARGFDKYAKLLVSNG